MTYHYAGDEAGDVSFAFGKGASRYFVIVLIRTPEPDKLREAMFALKTMHRLPETFEFSFHALTNPRLKERVFNALKPLPFEAWALIVDKPTLPDPFRVMPHRIFYNFFLTELVRHIPEPERSKSVLWLDEFDRSEQTLADLGKAFKARGLARGFKKIKTKRSRSEPLIQCADLMAGAILARYIKGDDRYWRVVRGKFIQVIEYPTKVKPPG